MNVWYKFKDLIVGDKIIVTDFINECKEYEITHINTFGFSDKIRYFFAKYVGEDCESIIDFRVDDVEETHVVIDGCRWVYINGEEFIMDCNSRIDRIKSYKEKFLSKIN